MLKHSLILNYFGKRCRRGGGGIEGGLFSIKVIFNNPQLNVIVTHARSQTSPCEGQARVVADVRHIYLTALSLFNTESRGTNLRGQKICDVENGTLIYNTGNAAVSLDNANDISTTKVRRFVSDLTLAVSRSGELPPVEIYTGFCIMLVHPCLSSRLRPPKRYAYATLRRDRQSWCMLVSWVGLTGWPQKT